ncbi:MAG: site-specific DNA-methyltransferase [Myxococcales bacterium]|nr:site-specific DNA-methyltransferase [Myxococcales bacterium]
MSSGLMRSAPGGEPSPYYLAPSENFSLYQGDCIELVSQLGQEEPFDLIFADPPYFLSNGGVTCKGGRMVSVHKGDWDRSRGADGNHEFNLAWLEACQQALSDNGTIMVSGTHHTIYSIGHAMQQLGFKILNALTWVKPNPPPNLSCRYFTHATETILWAARDKKAKHHFNYKEMKAENGGKQMKSVWTFSPPRKAEKRFGKHPTQKPLPLLERIIRAASDPGHRVLDPFNGSGTTGIAAIRHGRRYVGIDLNDAYLDLSVQRYEELVGDLPDERDLPLVANS